MPARTLMLELPHRADCAGADSRVMQSAVMTETTRSSRLVTWIILVAAAPLAASRRRWGTVAIVVLTLLGMVLAIGGRATHSSR